ncbi:MAG: hypothetical protein ACPGWR_27090 [Ardenticatenaceae bacterium]
MEHRDACSTKDGTSIPVFYLSPNEQAHDACSTKDGTSSRCVFYLRMQARRKF